MQVTFVGCGDAFGSGGRFNTCFHVAAAETNFLIDCGATSLVALKRLEIDRNAIDTILITHFHGDHFGGLPYFILDAQFGKRTRPLTIVGPPGLNEWYERVLETAFAGSSRTKQRFEINLVEISAAEAEHAHGLEICAAQVLHGPPDAPVFAYRILVDGKVLAYTADTEWVDELVPICQDADLLIAEAYFYEKKIPFHLDVATLEAHLPAIQPKRLILTHMSEDMLQRVENSTYEVAEDGKTILVA